MAIVPLKQIATIAKLDKDDWGNEVVVSSEVLKCRVDNISEKITDNTGETYMSTALFWFDKYPNITYDHEIIYEDERGNTVSRRPRKIDPVRMINGNPTLTLVNV